MTKADLEKGAGGGQVTKRRSRLVEPCCLGSRRTLAFWQASDPHPFIDAFPAGEISRVVSCRTQSVLANAKGLVESDSGPRDFLRLVQLPGEANAAARWKCAIG